MKTENIIDFKNIYVNYGINFSALKNINLKVNSNENWAILGANGCGKSTLIKLISNDLYPNTKYPFSKKYLVKIIGISLNLKKN
ncbi:MAG: ATP-binding cassette domain-containing protein [Fusobacteriaceae bacterium]|nr:ATP-binding cassette domain-containing protein [Fusobacteriaceae bacterium]MBN2837217.1 ATP-binding cassette domain-containing protein [Fusobacteriaceae bacterium]